MVRIRTTRELILGAIDFYRTAKPQLDTKPATVARDLLVDGPAAQLAQLYQELARIRSAQSLRLSLGNDLDKWAANFGATRRQGSTSNGNALYTFNEIEADIPVNKGDVVTANNGSTFLVENGLTVSVTETNLYRATASKYRAQLDFAGIEDEFAVEVAVRATSTGTASNISRYALTTTSTPGVSNVTNVAPFSGGQAAESDAAFRSRILAVFSGANTGTALGYRNAVIADPAVIDAIVIEPGDPLMTRDGTQVSVAEDGTRTILSEGTGGKVDIYVYGFRLVAILNSYIYRDQSNTGDPTDPSNDYVLGQIEEDENKTVTQKRKDDLETGILPDQPVNNIISVSGSSSGPNFLPITTDSLGRVSGNYELIPDTGAFAGSPWGFDRLRWIDDRIRDLAEDKTKGRFNGQDSLTYADVLKIGSANQNIAVTNENSRVNPADRTSVQLAHKPITNVTRVFNLTTGERYVVASQNPDGSGTFNETGRIVISGSTLPAVSDTLQVDYTWVFRYDPSFDYDNRLTATNPRQVVDSVDWGFSNAVRREESTVQATGSLLTVDVTHPISTVINVNTFVSENSVVSLVSGRTAVVVTQQVTGVTSVVRISDGTELYVTSDADGSYSGLTIFLPTDTLGEIGDAVDVVYNAADVYTVDGVSGSFSGSQITLSADAGVSAGTVVECNYIADIRTLLPSTLLPSLPAVRAANGFQTAAAPTVVVGTQPTTHVFSSPDVIEQNLRQAPTRLQLTIAGSISAGVITVSGLTFSRIADAVVRVGLSGLTIDLSSAIKDHLGLSSADTIPSNVRVLRFISAEKVTTAVNDEVLTVENTFDTLGYQIRDNSFVKSESVINTSLSPTEIKLPATPDNEEYEPVVGEDLRVTFYIGTGTEDTPDTENVSFSKSGSLWTDKIFALVYSVSISSGFTSGASQNATLTLAAQNQPAAGTRYNVLYDYLAPKSNERITINYNNNSLLTDLTLTIEDVRPVGADVLVKAATPILVNTEMSIVVSAGFENSSNVVQQNVASAVTEALTAASLGTIVDSSDLINVAYTVNGVDRVRIISFNRDGEAGSVLSIEAQKNEYIQANTITVNIETR